MSGSLNKVIVIGHLGKDPEVSSVNNSTKCLLNIATDESYKNKAGDVVKVTEWHRVIVWNKQADNVAKHLKKGSQVCIEGSLKTRSWEAEDGTKRYITEINCQKCTFLGFPNNSSESQEQDKISTEEDQIPF